MKIMILAPYIYDKDMPEFCINKTGFGIMVNDIVNAISKTEDVELLTRVITNGMREHSGNYNLLSHTWFQILSSAKLIDWFISIKVFIKSKGGLKNKIRKTYYCLDRGYVRKKIKENKPDIIHIHGIGSITESYIDVCEELQANYIVTLHGLIGLDEAIKASNEEKKIEKDFLQFADKKGRIVSVISTGIKRRIEENYLKHSAENIVVITNGTYVSIQHENNEDINLKKYFNLPEDCRICVVIGSITENKNQMQIVEAYNKLSCRVREKCAIFMCGRDMMNGLVDKKIHELKCEDRIFMLGFLERSELDKFIEVADLNIVASLAEGFGLSIIEAYTHGVPTVTFKDLDAIEDLYNENAMILVEERKTDLLTLGIEKALEKKWNKNQIKEYSKKFSLENMADNYKNLYSEQLARGVH